MASQRHLCRTLEPVHMLHSMAKKEFADVIQLMILRWGDYSRLFR